jgi:hypothetical protein
MKVLYLPTNIASMPAITAAAMNKLPGVEAKCLSLAPSKYIQEDRQTIVVGTYPLRKNPLKWVYYKVKKLYYLVRLIAWADVIHWTWDNVLPMDLDIRLVKLLKKRAFVEWVGSDIRVPEILAAESKWYKTAFSNGYEYAATESRERSYSVQEKFRRNGFAPVLVPEMKFYLKPDFFDKVYNIQYRINTSQFTPSFPPVTKERILIVHAPSAKIAKGSNYIIPILEALQLEYNIEFKLLHNMPRQQVLEAIKEADIFVDQIILGSYAMAAMEAMCYGKPVVAYICPALQKQFPASCPIVNADADMLKDALISLIKSGEHRNCIGKQSRAYVEAYHDADKLATTLYNIYQGK